MAGKHVERVLRWPMYLQAAISAIVGVVVFLLDKAKLTKAEPVLASRVGDMFIAYAIVLVIVGRMLEADRRWLWVPIVFSGCELANVVVQRIIKAAGRTSEQTRNWRSR